MTTEQQKSVNQLVQEAVNLVAAATNAVAIAHAEARAAEALATAMDGCAAKSVSTEFLLKVPAEVEACIAKLRARAEKAEAERDALQAWQPIETAPENTWLRTKRVGEAGENVSKKVVHVHPEHCPEPEIEWVDREGRTTVTHHSFLPPTHWMPLAACPPCDPADPCASGGIAAIAAERRRQMEVEGWTIEHDDAHGRHDMPRAAACYAWVASLSGDVRELMGHCDEWNTMPVFRALWPWDRKWWKPTGRRRDLVKAGALIAAEIDRLDRAALAVQEADRG